MSIRISQYGVFLASFYEALNSKNDQVLTETMSWLENEGLLGWLEVDKELNRKVFQYYLHRIIFEGTLTWKEGDPELEELEKSRDHIFIEERSFRGFTSKDVLRNRVESRTVITSDSVKALLMRNSNFEKFSEVGVYKVSQDLSFIASLAKNVSKNSGIEELWKLAIEGRSFLGEVRYNDIVFNYGYLTREEIKQLLESLAYYQTESGQKYLQDLISRYGANVCNTIQYMDSTIWLFTLLVNKSMDYFYTIE